VLTVAIDRRESCAAPSQISASQSTNPRNIDTYPLPPLFPMGAGSSAASSSGESTSPNAYCSIFSPHPELRRALGSEKVIVWTLLDARGTHRVQLVHDIFTGRRRVSVDERVVYEKARTLIDHGSSHTVSIPPEDYLRCVVSVVERGVDFAYSMVVNEQAYPRFQQEFWRYSALWYVPKTGRISAPPSASPAAALSDASTSAASSAGATASAASSSSSDPSVSPHFHTVVALTVPNLAVVANGRPVDLHSSFSDSEHDPPDSTKHKFQLLRQYEGVSAAAAKASPYLECELTVWLDKNDAPLPAGVVSSHIPRDKKQGRTRFLLRVDGALLAQAPSPLVSLHQSLNNSSNTNSAQDTAGAATEAPAAAANADSDNVGEGTLDGANAADEGAMLMSALGGAART